MKDEFQKYSDYLTSLVESLYGTYDLSDIFTPQTEDLVEGEDYEVIDEETTNNQKLLN